MNERIAQVNSRENWAKEFLLGGMEQNPADVALRSREDGYRGLAPSDPTAHRSLAPEAIAADESWTGAASSASGIVYWLRFGCEGPT